MGNDIIKDIKKVLVSDYLMTEAATPLGIRKAQFAVRLIGDEAVVFCTNTAEDVVKAVLEPFGAKVIALAESEPVKEKKERPARGAGFGMGWRTNAAHKGVEVSFTEKPSEAMREALKAHKFRWSHTAGVWYAKDTPEARAFCAEHFDEREGV
jgi:hypothetical protein